MLNRTNLTLSALALSNRLNLGTRSLAACAGVNTGDTTLRIRPSHHDVMREGMEWYVVFSNPKPRYAIPAIPCSFSPVRERQLRCDIAATASDWTFGRRDAGNIRKVSADRPIPSAQVETIAATG